MQIARRERLVTRDAAFILAATFCYMACFMVTGPVVVGFTMSLGATVALAGVVSGVTSLCSLVCRPVAGNVTDRVGKRRLAMASALLMLVSSAGHIVAASPIQLVVFRVIGGVGYSLCSVCMSTWFAQTLPQNRVGAAMSLFGMMNALGVAVGPALGISLFQSVGYRAVFVCSTVLAACSIACMGMVHDPGRPVRKEKVQDQQDAPRTGIKLLSIEALPAAVMIILFAVPYFATQSYLVNYVADRALPVAEEWFFTIYAAVLLAMRIVLRDVFDRVSFRVFTLCSSASMLASLVLLWCMHGNLAMVAAAVCMAGGYGIMCSVCQSTAVKLAGPGKTGLANSTYYMGFDIGMFLGPAVGGVVYGAVAPVWFYPALAVCVPLALAVLAAAHCVQRAGAD
ncbi:MFS transporter [Enorma phocaeensis]|uniref:MFS transporter n=1 Tax=Enorma phocaeensis TaxID=1871019 RepID=UPI001C63E2CB|nr:MFS transporter [Enorma phocaeensis]